MIRDNPIPASLEIFEDESGARLPADTHRDKKDSLLKVVFAASIGNALEWYDLAIYGFLAIPISRVFFPSHDEVISLLLTLGTFGASYFMRPLGALYLGSYADRHGRKAGMTLTILLMGIGTLMITAAPTYAVAGIGAPLIVVCAKFLQGFSAGGEFGSSVIFLVEHAPKNRQGFLASFQIVGVGLATALASLVGAGLNHFLPVQRLLPGRGAFLLHWVSPSCHSVGTSVARSMRLLRSRFDPLRLTPRVP